ncbi:hypothetical protein CathTA2_2902 [Caldalkalibacillus thermarum TA2.A1]|uniref:Uncharacterized protein n=1 Tax=Caldalkalibacillus thermarum (strain TA2.A1) TaxID=986075 RepID=F5LAG7_CALTT|nr:hypothetical protein [Caldalkalibacillus thermarum]EGL81716.1 hypothetical protein CathTA2_2902 [Caldalkalibacillus thermarum TA2.A1]QZT33303.1 hypothetical protein HUR95_13575 [Caldalkalibacillus thermarum TA2.A1]
MDRGQTEQLNLKWLVMLSLGLAVLLIPGLRRFMLTRIIRNKMVMSFGLNTLFSIPFIRDRLLSQVFTPSSNLERH